MTSLRVYARQLVGYLASGDRAAAGGIVADLATGAHHANGRVTWPYYLKHRRRDSRVPDALPDASSSASADWWNALTSAGSALGECGICFVRGTRPRPS